MVIRIQASDGPGEGDIIEAGIDDVMILEGILNLAPSPPALLAPAVGDTVAPRTPRLWVANGHDADPGDTLIYFFEVYSDSLLTRLEASVSALPEGIDSTYWDVDPPLLRGVTHWWRAFVDDGTERSPAMPAGSFLVEPTAGVAEGTEEPEVAGPLALTVGGPNPAPARASRLSFRLPRAGVVDLAVYDVRGRLVRRLLRERRESGEGRAEWDGRDERGRPVASGVYLVRLALGSESLSRKITLIR